MANAAAKKQASANAAALKKLHTTSTVIMLISLLLVAWRRNGLKRYAVFSLPGLATEYYLDVTGRPRYRNGQLVGSGTDLSQGGLTEYMHDMVYVTWISAILAALIGPKAWLILLLVPVYLLFKGLSFFRGAKGSFSGPPPSDQSVKTDAASQGSAPNRHSRGNRRTKV